jgi:AcrR family transcriptional regulator
VTSLARGRGRRRGQPDTRGEILAAARTSFAARGYGATTIREVAAAAGVDPSLVHHYFGSKDDLFRAALEVPVDPRQVVAGVFAEGLDGAGERLLRAILAVWADPERRKPLEALVRSALAPHEGPSLLEEGFVRMIIGPLRELVPKAEAERRGALVASQILGLFLGRYVARLTPLATADDDELVAWVAPVLQRYLTGPPPERGPS